MATSKKRGRQRANGEGAISDRKDGRKDVELTVYGPFGPRRLRTTKKNRTEALAWIEQMKRDHADGGLDLDAKNTTVGEFLDLWLRDSVKGSVARHTYVDYEGKVRLHLKPAIGHLKLAGPDQRPPPGPLPPQAGRGSLRSQRGLRPHHDPQGACPGGGLGPREQERGPVRQTSQGDPQRARRHDRRGGPGLPARQSPATAWRRSTCWLSPLA